MLILQWIGWFICLFVIIVLIVLGTRGHWIGYILSIAVGLLLGHQFGLL